MKYVKYDIFEVDAYNVVRVYFTVFYPFLVDKIYNCHERKDGTFEVYLEDGSMMLCDFDANVARCSNEKLRKTIEWNRYKFSE